MKHTSTNKKKYKSMEKAKLFIYAGANNTIFTLTDLQGNTIAFRTPKMMGFKNCKKSTAHAIQIAANAMKDIIQLCGNPKIQVIFSGCGQGKESIMMLHDGSLTIESIEERFSPAHNGPSGKRARRL